MTSLCLLLMMPFLAIRFWPGRVKRGRDGPQGNSTL